MAYSKDSYTFCWLKFGGSREDEISERNPVMPRSNTLLP